MFDINQLKKNPRQYASTLSLKKLVALLKQLDAAYHTEAKPLVPDEVYDIAYDVLAERDPSNTYLQKTGAKVKGKKKVTLPNYMPSLDKIKPEEERIKKWLAKYDGPFIVSDKLDGISLQVSYVDGKPVAAYTRGNGTVGQNVSQHLSELKIPKKLSAPKTLDIRAEVIMKHATFSQFDKQKGGKFDNPRNMAAGQINRLDSSEHIGHFDVVAYEILSGYGSDKKPSAQLKILKSLGFKVVWYTVLSKGTEPSFVELHNERKEKSPYEVDGIVIFRDKPYKRPKVGKPTYAMAFKVNRLEAMKDVKVTDVTWDITKTGKIFPTIQIEPTRIGGVTVTNVTGHNAFFIMHGFRLKDKKKHLPVRPIGKGAVIRVVRSGDVIPHVVEVVKPARRPQMPTIDYRLRNGVEAFAVNIDKESSEDLKARRMLYFFTALKIEGVKIGNVKKLRAAGFKTINKLFNATAEDFLKVEGFKEKSAKSLVDNINKGKANLTFVNLADASGLFGEGISAKRLTEVYNHYPDILSMAKLPQQEIIDKIRSISGFETTTAKKIAVGLPKFAKLVEKLQIKLMKPQKIRKLGDELSQEVVLFSTVRDKNLADLIVKHGGTVVTAYKKGVTTVIVKDEFVDETSKIKKAKDDGAKIVPLAKYYDLLDKRGIKI